MSRRLTDEEIAARYSQQYRVETPEAGLGTLLSSGASIAAAAALELPEAFGLSREYRLAQEADAEQSAQRYFNTNQDAVGSYKNISNLGDVGRYAAELGAQSLPSMVPIIGAGLVGGPAAAYGVAGLTGIGAVAQAQREQSGRTDLTAIPLGLAYGGVEAATGIVGKLAGTGIRAERAASAANRYLDNLGGFTGGVARTGAAFGRTGFSEALGEVGQEYISNVGRLAIDPRVELFSPEAMDDYAESFVGGGLLGGLLGGAAGGWRRSQGFRDATRERDLTSAAADQETELQRPLDSQFVTQDQTLGLQKFINQNVGVSRPKRKDYVAQFKAAYDEPTGQFVNDPETGIERPLTVGEALQRSQAPLDMTQKKPADAAATAQVVSNTVRDPRSYELRDTFNVTPTPSSLQFYSEITADAQAAGVPLDSDLFIDVWKFASDKPMTPKRLEKARELLDSAIIKARQEAPSGTGISTVQQPAGSVGVGSPVVQGSLGDAGRPAPATGAVVGGAPAAGAPFQQAGILSVAPGQPSTTVTTGAPSGTQASQTIQTAPQGQTTTTRGAAGTTALVDTSDDALEIARATGNASEIEAMREEEAGLRADQRDFTEADLNELIDEQLGKGKNKERDRKILRAYILSRRMETEGAKGDLVEEIANTFGITEDRVRQIGNPEKLAKLAVEKGFDRNQVFDMLGIESAQKKVATKLGKLEGELTRLKKKAKPSKADAARMAELDEQITRINDAAESGDMAAAFKEAGIEGEAGEAFGNLDDAREWQKASTEGSQMAVKLVSIADTIAELKAAAAELKQLGLTQAEAAAAERVNELTAEYEAIVSGYEAKPEAEATAPKKGKGKGKAAEKAAEEKDAAKEAEAAKFRAERAAKLQADRNGLAVGDTVKNPKLGTGVVKSFAGDGDATTVTVAFQSGQTKELSVKLAKLEKTNAVQVESAASVPVQPKAETGEKVGRQVRRAPKPATESKAQVPAVILTQAEQAAQAWDKVAADFPEAPKFADLTKAQQNTFIGFGEGNWERGDVELELTKMARAAAPTQRAIGREPVTIDVESRVVEETVAPQVAKLPAPQVTRLENHYNAKQGTPEFLAKVKADVVLYATKGAEAVAGAIRDIIKSIHAGVLSVAMIFNPTAVSQIEAFVVIPQETQTTTTQVLAELPAEVQGMSEAGKQAYATLIPALKGKIGDKFVTIADKPSGRIFVFKANGDLVLQKKALFGLAKGDLYKGNNDLKQNRVTPAGLFGINVVDAAKGGDAAVTAGEYDFGKVFALDDPDATVTFMHSVWLKESDAAKRAAALKNDSAADSRYSFGCINVDKETFKDMVGKYSANMDGSKLFVVPDVQSTVNDFITGNVANDRLVREGVQPVTKTTTTPVKSATKTAGVDRTVAAKEEEAATDLAPKLRALRTVTTVDEDNASVELQEQELSRLEAVPGVGAATDRMRKEGLGDLVDYVGGWYVTDSKVNWDGGFTAIDGQAAVLLRRGALTDSERVEWTVYHEVGHAADQTHLEGGGVFSSLPEFNVRLQNGEIKPMGAVMKAAFDHYTNDPTSDLSKHLAYPFDRTQHGDLDGDGIREELFAQLWATYTTRDGREFLEDNLPVVADFMEQVYEQVKQTDYAAAKANEAQRTAQAGGQAAQGNGQPRQVPLRQTAVRFRANRSQGLIDRNIAKLPKQSQQPVKNLTAAIGDLGGKYLDYAVFTNDLVKRAQALGLGAAKTFSDRLAARNAKVSEEERKIEKIADRYASIEDDAKGSGPGSVNEFLFESTRTGKWGYGKFRDAKMGAAFDKLGPKAQQFVKDVFAHGDATLSSKKKIVLEATNSEYDAMIKAAQDAVDTATDDGVKEKASDRLAKLKAEKAATLKRFQTLFRVREGMPYAPIKRTGTYAVVAESAAFKAAKANKDAEAIKKMESDPNHYSVSFVDTKWAGRNLEASLAEAYPNLDINIVRRAEAMDDFSKNALMPALTKMRSAVTTQNTREDGKIDPSAGKLLNIINQLYLEALAEGSARKSEMRRRGVAGEVDMLQSFTQQGRADANFLASVEFEPKIQDALQQMRNQSRTGDRERKSEVFNELTQRYADSLEPKDNPFINGLTNMASKFFLASSPGYYLQNLTQPFMMSLPAMAGRHDYTKAAAELAKAYGELGPLFKDVKLFDEQFDFSKVPADVRKAINDLVNQGKIDIGLATEINEYKVEADGNLSKFAQRLNKGMRMAVQKVEATNRLSTAIAAYRLEFAKTKDAAKATQYAADILTDTHGDYTAFNAPRVFNTQWGKVALQFRKFQLIQIAFYAKLFRDAFTKPEERAAALKTLGYSLGHTAVFAGMMGIPGYAAISAILGAFGDEDEPFDLTAWARKEIGPEWADIIMRGAPTVVGMDLSGKIGAGNMLSIMPFSDADLSTNAGRAEAFGTLMGGAALGMASRVVDGLGLILAGDYYKGVERTMPKGVSDALKAGRQAAEGMTRRNGDVILPDSEISAIDTVLTGLGVPAVKQAVTYERQNRMRDVTENFNDRTTRIKNDYAKAVREKDTAAMAEARAAWTKLQQTRQRNGLKPQPISNLLKAPQEQKAREQRTVGGVAYRQGQQKLAESIAEN